VFASRPAGSRFIAARDVPDTWRLFTGAARAAYSAPRLRFSPSCRDKRWVASDGGGEGASSVRSRAARMRDFEGPGSAIAVVGRKERLGPCGVNESRCSRVHRVWGVPFPRIPKKETKQLSSSARAAYAYLTYCPSTERPVRYLHRTSSVTTSL